jgi:uncharacterized Fe-S cluster protein YjdI
MQQLQISLNRFATRARGPIGTISKGHHSKIAVETTPMAKRNVQIGTTWWLHSNNISHRSIRKIADICPSQAPEDDACCLHPERAATI